MRLQTPYEYKLSSWEISNCLWKEYERGTINFTPSTPNSGHQEILQRLNVWEAGAFWHLYQEAQLRAFLKHLQRDSFMVPEGLRGPWNSQLSPLWWQAETFLATDVKDCSLRIAFTERRCFCEWEGQGCPYLVTVFGAIKLANKGKVTQLQKGWLWKAASFQLAQHNGNQLQR